MLKEGNRSEVFIIDLEGSSVEMRAIRHCGNRFMPNVEGKLHIAEDMSPATEGPRFRDQSAIQETGPVWEMVNDFIDNFSGYVDRVLAKSVTLGLWEGVEQEGLTMTVHGNGELKKRGGVGETIFIPLWARLRYGTKEKRRGMRVLLSVR